MSFSPVSFTTSSYFLFLLLHLLLSAFFLMNHGALPALLFYLSPHLLAPGSTLFNPFVGKRRSVTSNLPTCLYTYLPTTYPPTYLPTWACMRLLPPASNVFWFPFRFVAFHKKTSNFYWFSFFFLTLLAICIQFIFRVVVKGFIS